MNPKPMNILIVDDRPENIITLKAVINEYLPECEIFSATTGAESLGILENQKIDAALIDVQMPDISGIDLCRIIKADEKNVLVPVTLITAHSANTLFRTEGLDAGAHDFINRPIDNIELIAKIRVMLRLKQAEDALLEKNASLEELVEVRTKELRESKSRISRKLENILSPDGDLSSLEFEDIVDISKIQTMMDKFYNLAKIAVAIVDLNGKVLVAAGWQEICTNFHRQNSKASKFCTESDCELSQGIEKGEFKIYKCKNGLWDIVGPVFIGEQYLANIFIGQCILEGEAYDREQFIAQAHEFGFDEKDYLAALDKVPHWDEKNIKIAMEFYSELAELISTLSYSNIKLARSMEQLKQHEKALCDSEAQMRTLVNTIPDLVWLKDPDGVYLSCNHAFECFFGAKEADIVGRTDYDFVDKELADFFRENDFKAIVQKASSVNEEELTFAANGYTGVFETIKTPLFDSNGELYAILGVARDITERKHFLETILASEAKYKLLFESMLEGYALHEIICDNDGNPVDYRYLAVNPAFEAMVGLKAEDVIGKTVLEILPDTEPIWIKRYGEVAIARKSAKFEEFSKELNAYFEVTAFPTEPGQFGCIFEDITEKKQAENQLKMINERFDLAVSSVSMGVWDLDLVNDKLIWNDRMYEIYGIEPSAFLGAYGAWESRVHPDDLQHANEEIQKAIRDEKPFDTEFRVVWPDGEIRYVRASALVMRDADSVPLRMTGVNLDITEQKKAEDELRESENRYMSLVDNIPGVVYRCAFDKDWTMFYLSSVIEQVSGYPVADFINNEVRSFESIIHQNDTEYVAREISQAVESDKLWELEYRINHKDGSVRWVYEKGQCVRDADNNVAFLDGFILDVSDRKRAELELLNSRKRELDVGFEIQSQLLIGKIPYGLHGANVAACSEPTEKIGGDFYDFIQYDNYHFDLFIGDVMGKGIPAALCGAATKTQFLRAIYDLMCSSTLATLPTLEEIVYYAHDQICDKLVNLESFVTASLARFNLKKNRMDIIDCGHTATIHFHASSGVCDKIKSRNFPFGFSSNETYKQQSVHFKLGDIFCFYSDGVIETHNMAGELYGVERLMEFISNNSSKNGTELTQALYEDLCVFCGKAGFTDDITFALVKIEDFSSPASIISQESIFTSDIEKMDKIRKFVKKTLIEKINVPDSFVVMIELALIEAVANIIKHAYQNKPDKTIGVGVKLFAERIEVNLTHNGLPMEKRQLATPAFDGSHDNGYGLFLIRKCIDDIELNTDENGVTNLKLIKKL